MINKQFIVSELEFNTRQLEKKLFSHLSSSRIGGSLISNTNELEKENKLLQIVKKEVDSSIKAISNAQENYSVRYDKILEALKDLKQGSLLDVGKTTSPEERTMKHGITEYLNTLIYYTLVNKNISILPSLLADQLYYQELSASRWYNKLLYGLCIGPRRLMNFFKKHSWKELPSIVQRIIKVQKLQLVSIPTQKYWFYFSLFKAPITMVDADIIERLELIDKQLKFHICKFGKLVYNFTNGEDRLGVLYDFFDLDSKAPQSELLYAVNCWNVTSAAPMPSNLTIYWPSMLITLLWGPSTVLSIFHSRHEIFDFFKRNIINLSRDFIKNWIIDPIKNIWSTVRHDPKSSIAIISQATLSSELSSLQRMIIDFVKENQDSNIDTANLLEEVKLGNLTKFMEIYEAQLRKPVRYILTGELIRALLIQIQKGKLDGSIAIHGIDQLLKSQQLVFGIVSVSPALIILTSLWISITKLIRYGTVWSRIVYNKNKISILLNNIERLLNSSEAKDKKVDYFNIGTLALEMTTAKQLGSKLVPRRRILEWYRDIEDLISNNSLGMQGKLNVMNRIHHTYGRYF